jgi:hypothetical protein
MDQLLSCKIAESGANAQVVGIAGVALAGTGADYALDGTNAITGVKVVEIVLKDVTASDAKELSRRIDGDSEWLTPADEAAADLQGRVTHIAPVAGVTDVYIYLAHK